jgi:hypothetical protein
MNQFLIQEIMEDYFLGIMSERIFELEMLVGLEKVAATLTASHTPFMAHPFQRTFPKSASLRKKLIFPVTNL